MSCASVFIESLGSLNHGSIIYDGFLEKWAKVRSLTQDRNKSSQTYSPMKEADRSQNGEAYYATIKMLVVLIVLVINCRA